MEKLEGRVAVVTGAASGIGRAMARRFAQEGMRVVLSDAEQQALERAAGELAAEGHAAIGVPCDVRSAQAVDALRDAALDAFGAVHLVCNNAGVARAPGCGYMWQWDLAGWTWLWSVNVMGVVHGIRSFVPRGSKVVRGTRKEAAQHLNEQLHALDRGVYVKPAKETLGAYLERYLGSAVKVSPKTLDLYRGMVRRHVLPVLGAVELQKIDARAIQELVNGLSTRARTQHVVYQLLRQALGKAVAWGLIARNPTDHVEMPRVAAKEKRPLTADEVHRFREAARGSHYELVFDVLLASGMRPGEALGLRWQDVDFEAKVVRVRQAVTEVPKVGIQIVKPKTAKSVRDVPLDPAVMAGLRRHAAKQATRAMRLGSAYDRAADLVFATWTGGPVSHRSMRASYLRLCGAGIEGARGPYDLRHTPATLLIDNGVPIKAVSERLGHASVAITLGVYVHTTPAQHDRATAVLGEFVQ